MKRVFVVLIVIAVFVSQFGLCVSANGEMSNPAGTVTEREPLFSHPGGFYENEFDLVISTEDPGAKVYYTTDGSDPVPGSQSTFEFDKGIKIKSRRGEPNVFSNINVIPSDVTELTWRAPGAEVFKCTTIKAVVIGNDGTKSKVVTHTYFVDENINTRYSLPVISLVTDRVNLFDDETGIYSAYNCEKKSSEWERPMHMEFFEPGGKLGFSQYIGARIHGGFTRVFPQKSFRLYADHDYDEKKEFKYDIFPDLTKKLTGETLDSFSRLILRNGGNDGHGVMFRDELIQSLVSHLNIPTQAYRPAVVFLNGEYWGLYNIRERYDERYLSAHYNLDRKKVAILDVWSYPEIQEGSEADLLDYTRGIVDYLKENDITDKKTYDHIKTKMDIENFIDYNIANIYAGNHDWPGNNVCIWRYNTDDGEYHPQAPYGQDGRWRWFLKDTDFGLGIWGTSPSTDTLSYSLGDLILPGYEYANEPWAIHILKTLLKNDEFRNQFISRFADQINTSFVPERVIKEIDKAKTKIEHDIKEHHERWEVMNITDTGWESDVEYMKYFAGKRPDYVRGFIADKFKDSGVTGTVSLKLGSDLSKGYIRINTIDLKNTTPGIENASEWTGIYFKGVPATLKAIPMEGYKFSHWDGISNVDTTLDTISFVPEEDMDIKALYSPVSVEPTGYTLSGYVAADLQDTSADGILNEGFTIELSEGLYTTKTDKAGFFKMENINTGGKNTTVTIKKPGYLKREIKGVSIDSDICIGAMDNPVLLWPGDLEGESLQDNAINMTDIFEVAKRFNSAAGDDRYNSGCDFNLDLTINMSDIMIIARNFNKSTGHYPTVALGKP
jgi:hypothetical protein